MANARRGRRTLTLAEIVMDILIVPETLPENNPSKISIINV